MHPSLEIVEEDAEADRRLLIALADWCDRYTPLVALDPPDGLFLDITGCAHLFGGERRMVDDLLSRFLHQGFDVRAGLASTPGAAWAAARFALGPIARGEEAGALAPLPLAALRLERATREGLESVGLRRAGMVMDAPRAPLARRFGAQLLLRLDQFLGRVEEPVSPRRPVSLLSAERHLAEPILQADDIERMVGFLAAALRSGLERRGEGARRLELALFRVDGTMNRIAVATSRPLREPLLLRRLFRERLDVLADRIDAGYGFDLVRLSVVAAAPFDMRQADLAGGEAAAAEEVALLADRIRARLGDRAVLKPVPVESHSPERAVVLMPFEALPEGAPAARESAGGGETPRHRPERPIRLFRDPECVEVTAEVPEGPPLRFRWRSAVHTVARTEGPERIAPEWWRDAEGHTRDYFRVEDEAGRRYWIFRQGFYGAAKEPPRWFMHGIFA